MTSTSGLKTEIKEVAAMTGEDIERLMKADIKLREEQAFHENKAKSVKENVPEAVEIAPFDADPDGNSKSGEDYLTVQYERLVPLLIEGIKDQQKQIDEMKKEIKEIKNGTSK